MVVQIDESSDEIYFPDPHLGTLTVALPLAVI